MQRNRPGQLVLQEMGQPTGLAQLIHFSSWPTRYLFPWGELAFSAWLKGGKSKTKQSNLVNDTLFIFGRAERGRVVESEVRALFSFPGLRVHWQVIMCPQQHPARDAALCPTRRHVSKPPVSEVGRLSPTALNCQGGCKPASLEGRKWGVRVLPTLTLQTV